jgi:hypothetical protein
VARKKSADVVPLNAPDPKEDTGAHKAIGVRDFEALVRKCTATKSSMDTERATLGGLIADACENKHLHKGAFGIFRRLDSMDEYKRAELLFHLDLYRERAKWDTTDMFGRDADAAAE